MERRRLSFLTVQNPSDYDESSNIPPENFNNLAPSPSPTHEENKNFICQNQYPLINQRLFQNPNSQNHFLLQSNSQNHLLLQPNSQNHLLLQPNSQNNLLLQEKVANFYQMNLGGHRSSFSEPEVNMQNPNLSLEAALSRMNISSTPNHQSQFVDYSHLHQFPGQQFLDQKFVDYNRRLNSPPQPVNRMRSIPAGVSFRRAAAAAGGSYGDPFLNQSVYNTHNSYRRRNYSFHHDGLNYGPVSHHRARSVNGIESVNLFTPSRLLQKSPTYSALEQVKGNMAAVARDQEGCRFLQKKIDELIPEQTEMIFSELKDHVTDLIVDRFANYLIQKLFTTFICNEAQITQLLHSLTQNHETLEDICIHQHGTRAMQKVIELIEDNPEQISMLVSALKNITMPLSLSPNGHHVIQQCFRHFDFVYTQYILEKIAQNCIEISMNKSGCCVMQRALDNANGEIQEHIISNIIDKVYDLSLDPFGNYVVQYILERHILQVEAAIMAQLKGSYVELSKDKHASNVVEKCMKEFSEKNFVGIVREIIYSDSILEVLQHCYGNFVIQAALRRATGDIKDELLCMIYTHSQHLHSHLHGKKVLEQTPFKTRSL